MDKRQILDDLKKKYEEISAEYEEVRKDIVYFEGEPEFEAYNSYTEDAVKKEMFPKEYEAYQRKAELDAKLEPFEKELVNAATNLTKELNEKIESLENKVAVNEKYLKEAEEKIKILEKEAEELQLSKAYKDGDEETLIKYNNLISDLASEMTKKNAIEARVKNINVQLGQIKAEKDELIETYGEEIDKPADEKDDLGTKEGKENNGSDDEKNKNPDGPKDEDKHKDKSTKGGAGVPLDGNNAPAELSAEEKAKKEQEEKDKKLKEDFADLSSKAKKGKLTDKELDSFIDILKNKDNYEKLGLSMGLFINKPRGIFRALNKKYKDDESKLASINEAYSVYEEKFYEKHGEEKLKKLSKFFAIDEVEHKAATPALPEKVELKLEKKTLGDELEGKTVPDGEYVDISSSSKTKTVPTKEDI